MNHLPSIRGASLSGLFLAAALLATPVTGWSQVALTEKSHRELAATHGLVILQVDWGRYWNCDRFENAQLQKLVFRRLDVDAGTSSHKDWVLSPLSTLFTKSKFEPYAVYLDPGQYALSSFRFKVAGSVRDVRVAEPGPSDLIVDGKPVAGSFTVAAGEVVYIGHFGVDCAGEPTPWRYYIDGAEEFADYVDGFRKEHPFMKDAPVTFRLFETSTLGQPYTLPNSVPAANPQP
ncbi:MAG: hypothetical protein AMXMBFR37_26250 [Steroidobacteraceae bacterium]